ncbi:signal peptide protein [Rugosibacter aromaticivorans]|uniref:Signal peptide protein n=1 Tax=Rugosibacter aromaticivorans TaxID=1565605 RepID=A0A0C5JAJ9_9PROT|nr:ABC transporter substrate-binding protein [Rugosibacter aromaticivorans]AJP48719.1 signal peptide protein [Rugosibacter aromaticivorans]TBR14205.1 MAG: ABC transporter substrate-binding protein [Rugosibacter sp.]
MKSVVAFISSTLIATSVIAHGMAPDALIKSVSGEVLEIIRADKDIQSGNIQKAADLVEKKIAPNFDFLHMTRLALGRDWRQASAEQQKALANEFQILLVRTYSRALTEYKNQTIDVKPLALKSGETDVKVRSEIKQPGAKAIQLDYYLQKDNAGWKIYDIEVAGISLVTNYRESFANEVRNSGIDGLLKTLQTKNKSGDTVASKK